MSPTNNSECWGRAVHFISIGEPDKARMLCENKLCSGMVECRRYLGWLYYEKGDMEKSFNWFAEAAEQDDGESLFGIGSIYASQKNFLDALRYFESSANHGYVRSYQWIAGLYQHGCGMPRDIEKAIEYYKM